MKYLLSSILILGLFTISCVDRFVIPEDINQNQGGSFGAGDTTFLQLNPVWDASYGLNKPIEISIAQDGRIFVADSGLNSILVFDQNGNSPSGFDGLKNLTDENGNSISPTDVDIDQKMNVFFINGTQQIFVWNQYWNEIGISQVSVSGQFHHLDSGTDSTVAAGTDIWLSFLNHSDWELVSTVFSSNSELIDSLLNPHVFYDGRDEKNIQKDIYFRSTDSSKFTGLTTPANDENLIFVMDTIGTNLESKDRIMQIDFQRSLLLELANGDTVYAFTGEFGSTVLGPGSGIEYVNDALALDVDYQGNLYFTQIGEEFPIHMIIPDHSGDYVSYSSGFNAAMDDIMNPNLFSYPSDIAVDVNRNIYVVDTDSSHINVFDANGEFFKNVGYPSKDDSVSILNKPVAVAVDNRGVIYVCDRSEGAIFRFKLSNSLDEDIIPNE